MSALTLGCTDSTSGLSNASPLASPEETSAPEAPAASAASTPVYGYEVIQAYPHDPKAFTQGLVYHQGVLYEGTGLYGYSSLRRVELETGKVLQNVSLEPRYFGEGITLWQNQLIQLTWRSQVGFVYDRETFEKRQEFTYPTEGWGLTHDGTFLILSDGSANLYFLDPQTLQTVNQIAVTDQGLPVTRLNELEYINGEVFANVWMSDRIARIDPSTGQVSGWIDLTGLLNRDQVSNPDAVLNGIAYDAENDRLFVTGKLWPQLFEIRIISP